MLALAGLAEAKKHVPERGVGRFQVGHGAA
jgi:hypothetical protein